MTATETSSTAATQTVSRQRSPSGAAQRPTGRARAFSALASSVTGRIEPVAHRPDVTIGSVCAVSAQLAAQVADVDIDDVGARVVLVAPDGAQDLLAGEHPAAVAQQVGEQLELGRREPDQDAAPADLSRDQVDLDIPAGQRRGRRLRGDPQLGPDPRGKLQSENGLVR